MTWILFFHSQPTNNDTEESRAHDGWQELARKGVHQECSCIDGAAVQENGEAVMWALGLLTCQEFNRVAPCSEVGTASEFNIKTLLKKGRSNKTLVNGQRRNLSQPLLGDLFGLTCKALSYLLAKLGDVIVMMQSSHGEENFKEKCTCRVYGREPSEESRLDTRPVSSRLALPRNSRVNILLIHPLNVKSPDS